MRPPWTVLCLALAPLAGCELDTPFNTPEPPCDERAAWWPDVDGDGAADSDEVWVTCEDPGEGWTDEPYLDTDGSG
jgi:hypothetical protein